MSNINGQKFSVTESPSEVIKTETFADKIILSGTQIEFSYFADFSYLSPSE